MTPAWLHSVPCAVIDCEAVVRFWFDADREQEDRQKLVLRAASGRGWLFVKGRYFCPVHAESLRVSILARPDGKDADAIRWGIADRMHLCRIEVRP